MTDWDDRITVELPGGGTIEIPAVVVTDRPPVGIDSTASYFEGRGLSILIDDGPFAGWPVGHESAPGYEDRFTRINGLDAALIKYQEPDGEQVFAARVPELNNLTVVVRCRESVPQDVAERVLFSIQRSAWPD